MTILIVVAELSRFAKLETVYPLLMIIVTILGGIPIILRAFSALRYRVISIELLVAVAIIGARHHWWVHWRGDRGLALQPRGRFGGLDPPQDTGRCQVLNWNAPQTAEVIDSVDDATGEVTDIDLVDEGDLVLVKAGDRIPVDGQVKRGEPGW